MQLLEAAREMYADVPTVDGVPILLTESESAEPYEYINADACAPKSWTEHAYQSPHLFNELDTGGHFAAWEEPELFASEPRVAFRSLR